MARSRKAADIVPARLRALTERLFTASDALARDQGWTVEVRHRGLSRSIRDPRFDRLTSCPACGGEGETDHQLCPYCDGTGRIDIARPSTSRRRQS